eukprot:scaffold55089_cov57-Attheya_sp.AAC.1
MPSRCRLLRLRHLQSFPVWSAAPQPVPAQCRSECLDDPPYCLDRCCFSGASDDPSSGVTTRMVRRELPPI